MEAAAAAGETPRLPEELLATIISLTSPQDACRAAAVSRAFLAAADPDAVWSGFLPRDLPLLVAEGELPRAPPSKKALFRRLSVTPALLPCKLVSMRLDRATGAKCFLLSARALHIARGETPASWQWIHLRSDEIQGNERFSEAVRLRKVSWLEICAKMQCRMLSRNSAYAAYMVFKLADSGFNKLDYPFQVASVDIGWDRSTRKVCLQGYMEVGDDGVTRKHIWRSSWEENWRPCKRSRVTGAIHLKDKIVLPRRRADSWMEVELGEFYNEEGDDGEVSVSLMQTTGGYKSGLVVLGVEIRSKQCGRACRIALFPT